MKLKLLRKNSLQPQVLGLDSESLGSDDDSSIYGSEVANSEDDEDSFISQDTVDSDDSSYVDEADSKQIYTAEHEQPKLPVSNGKFTLIENISKSLKNIKCEVTALESALNQLTGTELTSNNSTQQS